MFIKELRSDQVIVIMCKGRPGLWFSKSHSGSGLEVKQLYKCVLVFRSRYFEPLLSGEYLYPQLEGSASFELKRPKCENVKLKTCL